MNECISPKKRAANVVVLTALLDRKCEHTDPAKASFFTNWASYYVTLFATQSDSTFKSQSDCQIVNVMKNGPTRFSQVAEHHQNEVHHHTTSTGPYNSWFRENRDETHHCESTYLPLKNLPQAYASHYRKTMQSYAGEENYL
ncbi:unnamed protein product [Sphenostylis stenocarpa]|uniref:Uncharacterized protein n=1 Tax=Sphenostylis stenocarpa TaxID=92480 RepID=A0AA87B7B4_9FABA|nr:unnamed protein product [Sphenostylis stenocarpa]